MRVRLRQFTWKSEGVPFIIRFFHLPKYMFDNASAKWSSRGKCDVNSGQWFCFRTDLGKCIWHRKDLQPEKRGTGKTHYLPCQPPVIHNSSCWVERVLPIHSYSYSYSYPLQGFASDSFLKYAKFYTNTLNFPECRLCGPVWNSLHLQGQNLNHLRLIKKERRDHRLAGVQQRCQTSPSAAKIMNF